MFEQIVSFLNKVIWSPVLVVLLVGAGLYFSFRTRFVQVRRFGLMLRALFSEAERGRDGRAHGMSSFQAFCVALSGRVGTGNIVGVATAIALGGPGAIFWMWIIAFFGASTAFVEATLAQQYKFEHATGFRGGPASYIEKGLKLRWLGVLFSILVLIGYGTFLPTVQANGMVGALNNSFHVSPIISGLALSFVLGLVIIGGVKSIARVAAVVTPFMAFGYIIITLIVIGHHLDAVPGVFKAIVTNAFGINPLVGGILGTTIMMGVKRGIFSNEAGQGGGAIVSAAAAVSHPAKQGLAQAFSVYVDTLFICTSTALMILTSGTYNILDEKTGEMLVANAPQLGQNYVSYTQAAVDSVLKGFGGTFVSIALVFFVFTTMLAYYFYGESSIMQIFAGRRDKKKTEQCCIWVFRFSLLAMIVFGSVREANVIWQLGDVGVGLTAWINVVVLLLLCPQAVKDLRIYETYVKKHFKK